MPEIPSWGLEAQTLVLPAEAKQEDKRDPLVISLEEKRVRQESLQRLFAFQKDNNGGQQSS